MNKSETILKDLGVWNPKTVMKWYKKKAFLYKKWSTSISYCLRWDSIAGSAWPPYRSHFDTTFINDIEPSLST